jgi:hypothetical protein
LATVQCAFWVLTIVQVTSSPKSSATTDAGAGTTVRVPVRTQCQLDAE